MTSLLDTFVDQAEIDNAEASWLRSIRAQGIERFNQLGIPTLKNEDWKYTNLRALASKQYSVAHNSNEFDASLLEEQHDTHRLVFTNGRLDAGLSDASELPAGVEVTSMSAALKTQPEALNEALSDAVSEQNNAFDALNIGLFKEGAFIKIAADCQLEKPIELVFIQGGEQTLCLSRNLIALEAGAKVRVIERQLSDDASTGLSNSATDILLAENARLDYNLVQLQGKRSTHIGSTKVRQSAGSRLNTRTITLGGQLVRNQLHVSLNGEGAHANCSGLYYGHQRQHIDNHTTIIHAAPSSTSRELYKGILDDRARGVFHGRIKVEQIAQLSESEQENPNLLLSRDAEVDTKPQLEIYADDVKCAHGATVGELDNKALFYLQSRGIDLATATDMLTYAFAAEVIEEIEIESLRKTLTDRVADKMQLSDI